MSPASGSDRVAVAVNTSAVPGPGLDNPTVAAEQSVCTVTAVDVTGGLSKEPSFAVTRG